MNLQTLMSPTAAEQPILNSHRDRYFATRTIKRGAQVRPLPPAAWPLDAAALGVADFMARHRVGGLLVLKDGAVALERINASLR